MSDATPQSIRLPGGLTGRLIRLAVSPGRDPRSTAARQALGEFEGVLSTAVSVALATFKAVLSWVSGSISMLADAVNNTADIASSLFIALSCRWARKPGDARHPFGHGRMETVATLVLSFFLIAVALQVAGAGVRRLWRPEPCAAPPWLLVSVGAAIALKSGMARFAWVAARTSGSEVIEADAWNHLFDIAATSLVLVALGGARLGVHRLDGWAAIGVSGFIAWTGIRYTRTALSALIGEAPSPADLARIRGLAASVPGVQSVHDILVHSYGDAKLVSFHIEVDSSLSLNDAHGIAEAAEARVAAATGSKVVVHVDPVDRRHPDFAAAEASLRAYVGDHTEVAGYHDLRLTGPAGSADLAVDIVVRGESDGAAADVGPMRNRLQDQLRRDVPGLRRIDLGFEREHGAAHEDRRVYPP